MKTYLLLSLSVLLLFSCGHKKSNETAVPVDGKDVVNLILDTDLGPDYDDVGAMVLMHALADSGLVSILATVSSNKDERVIPCIEVLNYYFNRPAIPVGAPKSEGGASLTTWHKDKWTDFLPSVYEHKTKKTSDAPDAVKVYRRILREQEDHSVTICTIGFFTNLKDLLLSTGDEYSPLSGKELVDKKVKRLVSMAARFPEGREFNVYCDIPASKAVIDEWPTEIIFSGFEIGEAVLTGKLTAKMPVTNSPVKDAYEMCLKEGDFDGRNSWDQTAVLVAIKGYEPYYSTEKGTVSIDGDGANTWNPSENGKHIRLVEQMPPARVASLIESYMMRQPAAK